MSEAPTSLQLAFLAVVQGLTEFLPISSSAHLILISELSGWADQGLSFDIAVHAGTAAALAVHLRPELQQMLAGIGLGSVRYRSQGQRLLLLCIVGSGPLAAAGLSLRLWAEEALRGASVIALANLFFAALLWRSWAQRDEAGMQWQQLSLRRAFAIGLWQCLAIIPGASRSGVVLTGGLVLGLKPAEAIRFSFFLALPAICGAALAELLRWPATASVSAVQAIGGAALAGLVAWAVLRLFTGWVQRLGILPFVGYRLLLGGILMVWLLEPWYFEPSYLEPSYTAPAPP